MKEIKKRLNIDNQHVLNERNWKRLNIDNQHVLNERNWKRLNRKW